MKQNLTGALRRTLLLKVISKPQPTREDVESVVELASAKVIEAIEAQSMTVYLLEDKQIAFKYVYYSPTLWEDFPEREEEFENRRKSLLKMRLPEGTGIVGQVIRTGEPSFYSFDADGDSPFMCFTATRVLRSPPCSPCLSSEAKGQSERCSASTRNPLRTTITLPRRTSPSLPKSPKYTAPLIQRMIDAGYKIEDRESAKFVARYTENRLVTDASEISVDENVITTVGEAIIRRTQILPYKRVGPTSVAVLMTNPLDYPSRENFQNTTDFRIDEIAVAPPVPD